MDAQGKITFTSGMVVRLIALSIIALSMPFLVTNPSNIIAIIFFSFGNFLMVLGGVLE